jgi:RHS repeat-associated protein
MYNIPHYPPFGSSLPNRAWNDGNRGYRFGFNGKEKDSETANDNFDFGARVYDGRLGRWMSLDPLMKKYPQLSSFCFTNNNPLIFADEDGRDLIVTTIIKTQWGTFTVVQKKDNNQVEWGLREYSDGTGGSSYRIAYYNMQQTNVINLVNPGNDKTGIIEKGEEITFGDYIDQEFSKGTQQTQTSGVNFTATENSSPDPGPKPKMPGHMSNIGDLLQALGGMGFKLPRPGAELSDPSDLFSYLKDLGEIHKQQQDEKKAKCNTVEVALCSDENCILSNEDELRKSTEEQYKTGKTPTHKPEKGKSCTGHGVSETKIKVEICKE